MFWILPLLWIYFRLLCTNNNLIVISALFGFAWLQVGRNTAKIYVLLGCHISYTEVTKIIVYFLISCWTFLGEVPLIRRDMDSTSRWKTPAEILSHAVSIAIHNCDSAAHEGICARTGLSIMPHKCLMVLKSGNMSSQIIRSNYPDSYSNRLWTAVSRWNGVLSSIKISSLFWYMKSMNCCK